MKTTRKLRSLTAMAAAAVALSTVGATVSTGTANATTGFDFTFNALHSGDCTMQSGAKWTINSDGTASFDGTVSSSSGGDAYLMWVELRDSNNAVLTTVFNNNWYDGKDQGKFAQNLSTKNKKYRWFATGLFDKNLFSLVEHVNIRSHC
ncbi:DUF6294 family protein [Nocardia sp. NPDC051030]|uniref:DUF6294 family protein n=1 Tax=Nocardia sp. NPDC051030 TaxID=3155162 RepID=UPI003415CE15